MCDPVSLTLMSVGISAAGSVVGGMQSAKIHSANAAALEEQAKRREIKAGFDADEARRNYRRAAGKNRAAASATGLDLSTFSDIEDDSALESALEVEAIKYGGSVDAANYRTQANIQRAEGRAAQIGGYFSAAGKLAGGAARLPNQGGSTFVPSWSTSVYRA